MDTPVSKGMLENAKAFANKIWNVGRFIITDVEKNAGTSPVAFTSGMRFSESEITDMPWLERALLSKCHGMCHSVTTALLENRIAPPTKELKKFLEEDLAAWYVEVSKTRLQEHLGGDPKSKAAATSQIVLLYLLEVSLKTLHPFMPFVTEAVWQRLPKGTASPESLMISPWPEAEAGRDLKAEAWFGKLCDTVSAIRNARAQQGLGYKERLPLTLWCADAGFQEALSAETLSLAWLAKGSPDQIQARPMSERPAEAPAHVIRIVVGDDVEVDMVMPQKEIDVEKEMQRLTKQLDQVSKLLDTTEKKISPQFLERANPQARDKILQKRDDLRQQKSAIAAQVAELQGSEGAVTADLPRRDAVAAALLGCWGWSDSMSTAEAQVGEGGVLPMGARQEDRIRKGTETWRKLPAKLKEPEDPDKEWEDCKGLLRRLYGLNDDMSLLVKGLRNDENRKKAETLIETFKKQVKAADKPAKVKDYDAFMVLHKEISGYLEEFPGLLVDANDDLEEAGEEEVVMTTR